MFTIVAALGSAFSYAVSDLFSQRVARGARPLTQVVWVLATGSLVVVPVALLVDGLPHGAEEWRATGLAALAGVAYFLAFQCLLSALRVGDLGLVSVLNSLQGAYAALAFIALGAPLTRLLAAGLALSSLGAVLTSYEGRARTTRGAGWAFASGVLFAAVFLLYGNAGDISWLSQAAVSRLTSLAVALPLALASGGVAVPAGLRGTAVGAGLLELAGLVLLTVSLALGPATVASVASTQFGTFAVLLGAVLLRERPRRHQWAGIAATIVGVSLLAAVV